MSATSAREGAPVTVLGIVPGGPSGVGQVEAVQPGDDGSQQADSHQTAADESAVANSSAGESAAVKVDEPVPDVNGAASAISPAEKAEIAARIRKATALPPFLRERFAALIEGSGEATAGKPSISVEEAIRALEEALPDFAWLERTLASRRTHPAGEAFFTGDPNDLSDSQAEEVARKQLARSGLLRGQRARIAD